MPAPKGLMVRAASDAQPRRGCGSRPGGDANPEGVEDRGQSGRDNPGGIDGLRLQCRANPGGIDRQASPSPPIPEGLRPRSAAGLPAPKGLPARSRRRGQPQRGCGSRPGGDASPKGADYSGRFVLPSGPSPLGLRQFGLAGPVFSTKRLRVAMQGVTSAPKGAGPVCPGCWPDSPDRAHKPRRDDRPRPPSIWPGRFGRIPLFVRDAAQGMASAPKGAGRSAGGQADVLHEAPARRKAGRNASP